MNAPAATGPKLQRVEAEGAVSVRLAGGVSRLDRLYQRGAARIRLPRGARDHAEAILINTAGGLTGGDRLAWRAEAEDGTRLVVTTQACEKVYRAGSGHAGVDCRLKAGQGAFLAWLPQETILFDRSALERRIEVDLAPGASLLMAEATIFGRAAMGETVAEARFRDRWRVRVGGRLVHAEEFALEGAVAEALARPAIANGAGAIATVLFVGEGAEVRAREVGAAKAEGDGLSLWTVGGTGKLLARISASDGHALRKRLVPLLGVLAGEAGLPRIWSS